MNFSLWVLIEGRLEQAVDLGLGEGTYAEVIKRQIQHARVVTKLDKKRPSHAHQGFGRHVLACGRHNGRHNIFRTVLLSRALRTNTAKRSYLRDQTPKPIAGTGPDICGDGRRRGKRRTCFPHSTRPFRTANSRQTRPRKTWERDGS